MTAVDEPAISPENARFRRGISREILPRVSFEQTKMEHRHPFLPSFSRFLSIPSIISTASQEKIAFSSDTSSKERFRERTLLQTTTTFG